MLQEASAARCVLHSVTQPSCCRVARRAGLFATSRQPRGHGLLHLSLATRDPPTGRARPCAVRLRSAAHRVTGTQPQSVFERAHVLRIASDVPLSSGCGFCITLSDVKRRALNFYLSQLEAAILCATQAENIQSSWRTVFLIPK